MWEHLRVLLIKVTFLKGREHLRKCIQIEPEREMKKGRMDEIAVADHSGKSSEIVDNGALPRILVVEDNDELRTYLIDSLSDIYNVQACCNGKEACIIVKEFWPELILSDIMMPEMGGDELCVTIKGDIETSHIPILLLTALGDERNILEGLKVGADDYITKPFNLKILRARIANLLANRALLREKYGSLNMAAEILEEPVGKNCLNALDWKFISGVRKNVEDNLDDPDFTVDSLCSLQNMSRSSFYNKLKALTGQAPADEDTILYAACFDANGGVFEPLFSEEDAIISDSLNHASIIDGVRLCKAKRYRYANADMAELEKCLQEAQAQRFRIVVTDGVFSMDGNVAPMDQICDLAEKYDALVMVDESHSAGVVGPTGHGVSELFKTYGRVDIYTGTLGKAFGGAMGGFTTGRKEIIDLLRQRSRPYLFSNSVAPAVIGASIEVFNMLRESNALHDKLVENVNYSNT